MIRVLTQPKFYLPCLLLLVATGFEYGGADLWLSRCFFDPASGTWPLRSHWLTDDLLHRGGRYLVFGICFTLLLLLVASFLNSRLKPYRKDFAYILVAGLSGPALVGWLKATTHICSPWDLQLFGGHQPYLRIFDHVPPTVPVGHAFPAGHSSGGFAWLTIYFPLKNRSVRGYRFSPLPALLLGSVFGIAQQARGAHFFSHDLFSLATCWLCAVVLGKVFYGYGASPEACCDLSIDTATLSHKVHP